MPYRGVKGNGGACVRMSHVNRGTPPNVCGCCGLQYFIKFTKYRSNLAALPVVGLVYWRRMAAAAAQLAGRRNWQLLILWIFLYSPFCRTPRVGLRNLQVEPHLARVNVERLRQAQTPIMAAAEAAFVAMVLVMMLSLLFVGWKTPEVVVSGPVPRSTVPKRWHHQCPLTEALFILKL